MRNLILILGILFSHSLYAQEPHKVTDAYFYKHAWTEDFLGVETCQNILNEEDARALLKKYCYVYSDGKGDGQAPRPVVMCKVNSGLPIALVFYTSKSICVKNEKE